MARWWVFLVVAALVIGGSVGPGARPEQVSAAPSGAVALSDSGGGHMCGIHEDGTLTCWGNNYLGQATPAPGQFTAVDGGAEHTCAIRSDQTLLCWGSDFAGELDAPPGTYVDVSAGTSHSCAVTTAGSIRCWGENGLGETDSPAWSDFESVTTYHDHSCAVRSDRSAVCWGSDAGQATFVPDASFLQVVAGRNQTCGIQTTGRLMCWGDETEGSLRAVPAGEYVDLALGHARACAVRSDLRVLCWGVDAQLNATPHRAYTDVAIGAERACAIEVAGGVTCWGAAYDAFEPPSADRTVDIVRSPFAFPCLAGATGIPECLTPDETAVLWSEPGAIAVVSARQTHGCTLYTSGELDCQLAYFNDWFDSVAPDGDFIDIALSFDFGCALERAGGIACWGDDPPALPDASYTALAAAGGHVCGLNAAGDAVCASRPGAEPSSLTPPVGPFDVLAVQEDSACGQRTDGDVECWGGAGDTVEQPPPGEMYRSLIASQYGFCAVSLGDSRVDCWATELFETPSTPPGFEFERIVGYATAESVCGFRVGDGVLQCWGARALLGEPFADAEPLPWPSVVAQNPVRILDTRSFFDDPLNAGFTHPGTAGNLLGLDLQGSAPPSSAAVALSVTVVSPQAPGFVTVWPCDEEQPIASSVNFGPGDIVSNTVIVGVENSFGGQVCFMSSASTDLVVDTIGFVPQQGSLVTVPPARLAETRPGEPTVDGVNAGTGRLAPGETLEFQVAGRGGAPADIDAAVFNVIAAFPSSPGFLTVWACEDDRPLASNINFTSETTTNMVFSPVGSDGKVCVYSSAATDVVVDLNAWVPSGWAPTAMEPARFVDTRPGEATIDGEVEGIGRRSAGSVLRVPVAGRSAVTEDAVTVFVNAAVVNPGAPGYLTMYPCDAQPPLASAMTYQPGDVRAAAAPVRVGVDGDICIFTLADTDLVIDISGYVANS